MTAKSITIRNVPEEVHRRLRVRAAHNGRSLEAEMRAILSAVARPRSAARRPSARPADDAIALTTQEQRAEGEEILNKVRNILKTESGSAA